MGGWGRNIPIIKMVEPTFIRMVDFNRYNITLAKEKYLNDPAVSIIYHDLSKWIEKEQFPYRLAILMWGFSYLDGS